MIICLSEAFSLNLFLIERTLFNKTYEYWTYVKAGKQLAPDRKVSASMIEGYQAVF